MAVTWVGSSGSGWVSGTGSVTPGGIIGIAVGDLVIIQLHSKYEDAALPSVPSGWTDGGSVANTARTRQNDDGATRTRLLYKVWQSGDSMPALSPSNNNVSMVTAMAFRSATGLYDIQVQMIADDTVGTPLNIIGTGTMGLGPGAFLQVGACLNGDAPTFGTSTVGGLLSGVTWTSAHTGPAAGATTSGTDMRAMSLRRQVSTGPTGGNASFVVTLSGTTSTAVGTGYLMSISEGVAGPTPAGGTASLSLSASGGAGARAAGTASLSLSASAAAGARAVGGASLSLSAAGTAGVGAVGPTLALHVGGGVLVPASSIGVHRGDGTIDSGGVS
jgi:hypothetical protein